jgi:hypothetical protein
MNQTLASRTILSQLSCGTMQESPRLQGPLGNEVMEVSSIEKAPDARLEKNEKKKTAKMACQAASELLTQPPYSYKNDQPHSNKLQA